MHLTPAVRRAIRFGREGTQCDTARTDCGPTAPQVCDIQGCIVKFDIAQPPPYLSGDFLGCGMTFLDTKLRFWRMTTVAERATATRILTSVITANADQLVSVFYGTFLHHQEGSMFLNHSVVHGRLSLSLRNWLLSLLNLDDVETEAFQQTQLQTGAVHARIGLPVHLMLEGGSLIKVEIAKVLSGLPDVDARDKMAALTVLDEVIDYAMRLMSASYVTDTKNRAHEDEAFRLFALGQDVTTERESQRAALMEWCQAVLFDLATRRDVAALEPLAQSPFGLWLRHRAILMFPKSNILHSIRALMERIDAEILPAIATCKRTGSDETVKHIGQLQGAIDEIKYLLSDLFQSATELESGRDPLTRVLNRKFLPSVLGREIALAKKNSLPLSIIMLDVDHFKAVNDRYGHTAGDAVLRQVAEGLMDLARASDFVFRYGGEEFLIVLVETDTAEAIQVAERLRRHFEIRRITLPDELDLKVTISAGVATYEGHPDYEYFIDTADAALLRAKQTGRNRVVQQARAA